VASQSNARQIGWIVAAMALVALGGLIARMRHNDAAGLVIVVLAIAGAAALIVKSQE